MRAKKGRLGIFLLILLLGSIALPMATALGSGFSPLDQGITLISGLFNISALDNPIVQLGFLKLMLFIVLFAVSFRALQIPEKGLFAGEQGKKTAGIVSFAFSMIGVFLMPTDWLMVTGGAITAIMSSFIFLFIFWGGAYLAVKVLSGSGDDDKYAWVKNLIGLILILFLLYLLTIWTVFSGVYFKIEDIQKLAIILFINEKTLKKLFK
jgi:hypothetical protein